MAKPAQVITHVPALAARVRKVATAFGAVEKAGVKLGDVVLEVASTLQQANIEPFCAMLRAKLVEANPGKEGSIKAQLTYIRRVVTAVVVDGLEIEPGQSLRGIYDALPKKSTGGATHGKKGAQLPNPANAGGSENVNPDGETETVAPVSTMADRAEKVKAAVVMMFGYCEPALLHAVQHAASNIPAFLVWAAGHSKAQLLAELEESAKPAPTKPARQRKQKTAAAA